MLSLLRLEEYWDRHQVPTFLEPQPQADLNDDENFRNGRNVIIDMCHTILETQALAD